VAPQGQVGTRPGEASRGPKKEPPAVNNPPPGPSNLQRLRAERDANARKGKKMSKAKPGSAAYAAQWTEEEAEREVLRLAVEWAKDEPLGTKGPDFELYKAIKMMLRARRAVKAARS
jgi:hypothetical protein